MSFDDEVGHRREPPAQQDALARANAVLGLHVDNSPLAVVEWDRDFRVMRWTGGATRCFGWEADEVLGLAPAEWPFVHPDDALDVNRVMDGLLTGQMRRNVSHNRNLTRDGRALHCVWYNSLVVDADQQLTSILSLVHDVTVQKQAEALLEASEARLRLLAEAATDAIWDWDLDSDMVWWSDGLEQLFGFSPRDVEPDITSWTSRVHPDDHDTVVASIRDVIDSGHSRWSSQYRFARKDGSHATVLDHARVIHDDTGRPVRMVGGMTDITRHVEMEEQLRQTQRLEAIGQLTGGIAHDFNNLLTVIQGNAFLLGEQLDDEPDLKRMAEMIETAAQRSAELVHRLLAFARRQALEPRPTAVRGLLEGMADLLRRSLGEHVDIVISDEDVHWLAAIDPGQLENAVLNLCINGRDAMPQGGQLTIEVADMVLDEDYTDGTIDVPPGDYVMVAVSDTGTGISASLLGRVFEPFFTTKEVDQGSGLGLAMVHGFVKQSGGHVTVYSEPGEGTTVRLYLPRHTGPEQPAPSPVTTGPQVLGPVVVLVVEDNDLVRRFAVDQLTALGCTVLEAADGPTALATLQERDDIELLFTDVVMPGGMTGPALARAATDLHPDLRILYASGHTESAAVHHGRLDPSAQLIAKPYSRADLVAQIRSLRPAPD